MKTPPLKVMHFIDSGGVYGAESVLLNLSEQMIASGEYEPIVGCIVSRPDEPSDLYDQAVKRGVRAEKIVIRNSWLLVDLPRAASLCRRWGVDLIHSHGYKPSVFGYAMKRLGGPEIMATCHLWFKGKKGPLKMRVMVAVELYLYRFFRVVVGVSQAIRDVLVGAGIDVQRTEVVANGVKVDAASGPSVADLERVRQELGLAQDTYCVLNTGRLTQQKAQCDLVTAAGLLRDRGVPVRVLIVGEGELRPQLARQIEEAGLAESVMLLGFRDDVASLLGIADVYAMPSLDEGMPMGLLEAAAAGVPVVATPVGDVPRLVVDQVTGTVVPVGDPVQLAAAIARLKTQPDVAAAQGQAAAERVQAAYSTTAMFAEYDRIYKMLLGRVVERANCTV